MISQIKKIVKGIFFSKVNKDSSFNPNMKFSAVIKPIDYSEDDDVFVVGFPKSGNTLMQQIIAQLVYGLNSSASRTMVELIAPDVYGNSHYFRFNDVCFFKSHELPKPEYRKVIYMIRDGREALLSYYHMKKNIGKEIELSELYNDKHKIFGTTWSGHIRAWEENKFGAEILFVRYEDLMKDKKSELIKICDFLKIQRKEKEIEQTIHQTSFEFMKSLEQKPDWTYLKKGLFKEGKNFVRKGEIDSYKEEVSEELLTTFESNNSEILNKYYSL